jgi:hypothetical protein
LSAGTAAFTAAAGGWAAALTAACLMAGSWQAAVAPVPIAVLWIFARGRGLRRLAAVPFPLGTLFSAIGLMAGLSPALCLITVLCGLCAWDLQRFTTQRERAGDSAGSLRAEKRHLVRLAELLGIGGLLGAVGLLARVQLGFTALFALGILLAAGFVGFLRFSGSRAGRDY